MHGARKDIISELKKSILRLQGFKPLAEEKTMFNGLDAIERAFPNSVFPTGAMHEFLSTEPENAAATGGFIAGLLQTLMLQDGTCLWISQSRVVFPPALKAFGIEPDHVIFIDVNRERDVLWVMEEALKCKGLAAVVGELREINFTQSRRLQLVVEKSGVTGFILRKDANKLSTTACTARWKISPLASVSEEGLPGLGFPRWNVELLKVRNGNTGQWKVQWSAGAFSPVSEVISEIVIEDVQLQTG